MFTDTKNFTNLTINMTTNAAAKQINNQFHEDDKFKLKKVWKPILRLMSRKSALARNGRHEHNNRSIPNNVNLNNACQYTSPNKDLKGTLGASSCATQKLTLPEFALSQQQQEQQEEEEEEEQVTHPLDSETHPLEFISKVSIEKAPLNTCTSCVHGRNCQHTKFHQIQTIDLNASSYLHSHPHLNQQNFNYYDASDGCFVWSDNSEDIDENALSEWLWQNSWQFADNATIC